METDARPRAATQHFFGAIFAATNVSKNSGPDPTGTLLDGRPRHHAPK